MPTANEIVEAVHANIPKAWPWNRLIQIEVLHRGYGSEPDSLHPVETIEVSMQLIGTTMLVQRRRHWLTIDRVVRVEDVGRQTRRDVAMLVEEALEGGELQDGEARVLGL